MKKVLMVAFHYPPSFGSSGSQRTLKFSHYLREHGWEPIVLSVQPMAYRLTSADQLNEIPENIIVHRTYALDATRHLSINGSHFRRFANPDPWLTWKFTAIPAGISLIRKESPSAIWSTFPIATAHVIANELRRKSGIPWIADYRDVMVENDYPADERVRRKYLEIDKATVRNANRVVVTTPGTMKQYSLRYPTEPNEKWRCIRNGYDHENFERAIGLAKPSKSERIKLLHSGLLYPSERDPSYFFSAIRRLKMRGIIDADSFVISLRSTGHDDYHARLIKNNDIDDIVELQPGIGYVAALKEMIESDGLLLFQAGNCNNQIPAKLYEYIRAMRPILAITDPAGETAETLRELGMDYIASIDDDQMIERTVEKFVSQIRDGSIRVSEKKDIERYSRRSQALELAALLDGLAED